MWKEERSIENGHTSTHTILSPLSLSPSQAEVRACVQKKGGGVTADLRELNFVLDV